MLLKIPFKTGSYQNATIVHDKATVKCPDHYSNFRKILRYKRKYQTMKYIPYVMYGERLWIDMMQISLICFECFQISINVWKICMHPMIANVFYSLRLFTNRLITQSHINHILLSTIWWMKSIQYLYVHICFHDY